MDEIHCNNDSNFTLESLLLLPRAPKTRLAKSQAKLPVDPIKGISRRYGLHLRYIFLVIRYVDLIRTAKSKCQVLKGGPACGHGENETDFIERVDLGKKGTKVGNWINIMEN